MSSPPFSSLAVPAPADTGAVSAFEALDQHLSVVGALSRRSTNVVEGFDAHPGVISNCFCGIVSPPPNQEPHAFNLIFETPAHAPFDHPVAANVAALDAVRAIYRGFIPHAQNL